MPNRKGLTFIEVILSVAIIGILSIVVLNIFGMGITKTLSAGERTKNILATQIEIDERINASPEGSSDEIKFKYNNEIISVGGILINSDNDEIITFQPADLP